MFENIGKGDYTIPGDCGPPLSDLLRGEALGTASVGLEVLGMGCQGVMGVLGVLLGLLSAAPTPLHPLGNGPRYWRAAEAGTGLQLPWAFCSTLF